MLNEVNHPYSFRRIKTLPRDQDSVRHGLEGFFVPLGMTIETCRAKRNRFGLGQVQL